MTKTTGYSVNLNQKELQLLKDLLDSEYFQVSGAVKISQMEKLKSELKLLGNLKLKLEQPQLATA